MGFADGVSSSLMNLSRKHLAVCRAKSGELERVIRTIVPDCGDYDRVGVEVT